MFLKYDAFHHFGKSDITQKATNIASLSLIQGQSRNIEKGTLFCKNPALKAERKLNTL